VGEILPHELAEECGVEREIGQPLLLERVLAKRLEVALGLRRGLQLEPLEDPAEELPLPGDELGEVHGAGGERAPREHGQRGLHEAFAR
jgi:hypothetical protein